MGYNIWIKDKLYKIEIQKSYNKGKELCFGVVVNDHLKEVKVAQTDRRENLSFIIDNASYDAEIEKSQYGYQITTKGVVYNTKVEDDMLKITEKAKLKHSETEIKIKAPMPGLVVAVEVEKGQFVKGGKGVVILEAMKMQNEITTPKDGIVKEIKVKKGDTVNGGDTLVILE